MEKTVLISIIIISYSFCTFSDEIRGNYGNDSLFLSTKYDHCFVSYKTHGDEIYSVTKRYWIDTQIDSIELKKGIIHLDPRYPNYWNGYTSLVLHFNNSIREHFVKKSSDEGYKYRPIVFMNKNMTHLKIEDNDLTITNGFIDVSGPPVSIKRELNRIRRFNLNNPKLLHNIDNCIQFLNTIQNIPDCSPYSYHLEYLKAFPEAINDSICQINTQIFNESFLLDSAKAMFKVSNIEKAIFYLNDIKILDAPLKLEAEELYFLCQIHYEKYEKVVKTILKNFDKGRYFTEKRQEIFISCINEEPKLINDLIKKQDKIKKVKIYNKLLRKLILQKNEFSYKYASVLRLQTLLDIKKHFHADVEIQDSINNSIFQQIIINPDLTKKFLKYRRDEENKSSFSPILKRLIFNKQESKESYSEIIRHISAYFNRNRDHEIERYLIVKTHNDRVL